MKTLFMINNCVLFTLFGLFIISVRGPPAKEANYNDLIIIPVIHYSVT